MPNVPDEASATGRTGTRVGTPAASKAASTADRNSGSRPAARHFGFRRDLNAFVATVPLTELDDRAHWVRLAERRRFFSLVLHKHHAGEDAGL